MWWLFRGKSRKILKYLVSSRPAWTTEWAPISKNRKKKKKNCRYCIWYGLKYVYIIELAWLRYLTYVMPQTSLELLLITDVLCPLINIHPIFQPLPPALLLYCLFLDSTILALYKSKRLQYLFFCYHKILHITVSRSIHMSTTIGFPSFQRLNSVLQSIFPYLFLSW